MEIDDSIHSGPVSRTPFTPRMKLTTTSMCIRVTIFRLHMFIVFLQPYMDLEVEDNIQFFPMFRQVEATMVSDDDISTAPAVVDTI